jgi:hypothetical protein
MGVYSQHTKYFNSIGRNDCPRLAFLSDLKDNIVSLQEEGSHIIVLLDGNKDMRRGALATTFKSLLLREVILERHGNKAPSTYRRNNREVPIDGIWASPGIVIKAGGYFSFYEIIEGTDHRALWIDVSYKLAFGHDGGAPIVRPKARRLNNQNPTVRDNYNYIRWKLAEKCASLDRIITLEHDMSYKMPEI